MPKLAYFRINQMIFSKKFGFKVKNINMLIKSDKLLEELVKVIFIKRSALILF